jgi:hypothetical protein
LGSQQGCKSVSGWCTHKVLRLLCLRIYCSRDVQAMVLRLPSRLAPAANAFWCLRMPVLAFGRIATAFSKVWRRRASASVPSSRCRPAMLPTDRCLPWSMHYEQICQCVSLPGRQAFDKPSGAHSGCRCVVDATESACWWSRNMLINVRSEDLFCIATYGPFVCPWK